MNSRPEKENISFLSKAINSTINRQIVDKVLVIINKIV